MIIRLKSLENGTSVRIEVEDSGKGIPEEKIGTIFESFKQVDGLKNEAFGSTGLGLAITKNLCEMLDIEISVESEIGKGTMFWFQIPIHFHSDKPGKSYEIRAATATDAETLESEHLGLKQSGEVTDAYSILLVDDDETNLDLMKRIFTANGATVYTALSARAGIDLAIQELPDVILMDLLMPGMSGFEAIRLLKQESKTAEIPVISCTAVATEEFRREALQAGSAAHILRPIGTNQLIEHS